MTTTEGGTNLSCSLYKHPPDANRKRGLKWKESESGKAYDAIREYRIQSKKKLKPTGTRPLWRIIL